MWAEMWACGQKRGQVFVLIEGDSSSTDTHSRFYPSSNLYVTLHGYSSLMTAEIF